MPKLPNEKIDKVGLKELELTPDTRGAEGVEGGDYIKNIPGKNE